MALGNEGRAVMESPSTVPVIRQVSARKAAAPAKDLWAAVRNGTPGDVDCALAALKKTNGNVDARNCFGSTALHIAVWRNHLPILRRLLAAGANMDIRDGESGWSSLHRALHFGHLAVAGVLIEAGANLLLEDSKGRTPVDLVSGPVKQVIGDRSNAGGTDVFGWGNGANYQLGTGSAGIQKLPYRLDCLQGLNVTAIAAAKFHSMAVTADGKLYSWGFGRGGRLGFSDFDIHSGQVAVLTPQLVFCGLGNRRVKIVAVAKHHSLVVTEGGDVFTWGSNREGQLGYTSVDTQPTPRRVTTLKAKIVAAAVANKHSAVLTEAGEVFTWGCNREGQLGYGTSNSASNPVPRVVEYVKGKAFCAVSAAKYHTVVLGVEGEVFTWGYKLVMPRRVPISRNTKKAGNTSLKFHQAERLHVVSVAAGATHSTAISEDGLIFYWFSADPNVRCHQLISLAGHQACGVAAGKYRTAVITSLGDVYAWDGEKAKEDVPPVLFRVHGIKHTVLISVGENHSIAVAAVYTPRLQSDESNEAYFQADREADDIDEDIEFDEMGLTFSTKSRPCSGVLKRATEPPTLKELCESVISQHVVEPKNALQLLEIADSVGACKLRKHCEDLVLHNLDYILTVSPTAFAHVTPGLLADLEKALDATSSQPWSHRLLPTPTALFPAIVDSEEDDGDLGMVSRMRSLSLTDSMTVTPDKRESEGLFNQGSQIDQAVIKQLRALKKKLQQIEALELRQVRGHILDHQQLAKLESKTAIRDSILALDPGAVFTKAIAECDLQFPLDCDVEGLQAKEVGNRRTRNRRRKGNKANSEEIMPDEPQKKRNGQPDKAGTRNCDDLYAEAQSRTISTAELVKHQISPERVPSNNKHNETFSAVKKGERRSSPPLKTKNSFTDGELNQVKIHGFMADAEGKSVQCLPSQREKHKKGGLSTFLSGALDCEPDVAVPVPTPTLPKNEAPAWGGAKRSSELSSLREIQSQQTAESTNTLREKSTGIHIESKVTRKKQNVVEQTKVPSELEASSSMSPDSALVRFSLDQFIRTSAPIAVTPMKSARVSVSVNLENSPTPWAGTSPLTSASSFKEIQIEQGKGKKHQKHVAAKVPTTTDGHILSSACSLEKVADEKLPNRWFKPDTQSASSIRCIQIEEQAIKEISSMYKNVKVVRSGDR